MTTCDRCDQPAVTQVTHQMAYGLYCRPHGREADTARLELIARNNRKARR